MVGKVVSLIQRPELQWERAVAGQVRDHFVRSPVTKPASSVVSSVGPRLASSSPMAVSRRAPGAAPAGPDAGAVARRGRRTANAPPEIPSSTHATTSGAPVAPAYGSAAI